MIANTHNEAGDQGEVRHRALVQAVIAQMAELASVGENLPSDPVSCSASSLASSSAHKEESQATCRHVLLNQQWEEMFEHLLEYKKEHGDCLVPNRYPKGLGAWVSTQRRTFKSNAIRQDRKTRLDEMGFVWTTHDPRYSPWFRRYNELLEFHQENGHSLVPMNHPNKRLANWISVQRQEYKNGTLRNERIQLLDELSFVWDASKPKARREMQSQGNQVSNNPSSPEPCSLGSSSEESGIFPSEQLPQRDCSFRAGNLKSTRTVSPTASDAAAKSKKHRILHAVLIEEAARRKRNKVAVLSSSSSSSATSIQDENQDQKIPKNKRVRRLSTSSPRQKSSSYFQGLHGTGEAPSHGAPVPSVISMPSLGMAAPSRTPYVVGAPLILPPHGTLGHRLMMIQQPVVAAIIYPHQAFPSIPAATPVVILRPFM